MVCAIGEMTMPVYQTNLWVCEGCNKTVAMCEEVYPYDDPVVADPPGGEWEYIGERGHEKLVCPECVVKHKQKEL